ncbi:cytochrome c biogenesis protein ResB [Rubritalea tangerina]|uniref:cytochrome c biogenesis protein ResB n=1 Tax=Rubritalea tangerina TaxID=430798 RepID=UPI00360A2197
MRLVNDERKFKIEMNEPLRYKKLTFYQTSWDDSGEKVQTGFTVKTNPSDQWPKYAIYTCGVALFILSSLNFLDSYPQA